MKFKSWFLFVLILVSVATVSAQDVTVAVTSGSDWWSVELAAPRGEQLHPGTYSNAERAPFRTGRSHRSS